MSVYLYPASNPDYEKNGVPLRITSGQITYADKGRYDADITLPYSVAEAQLLQRGMHILADMPAHTIPEVNLGEVSYWKVPAGSANVPMYRVLPHWETFLYAAWEPYRSYMVGDRRSYNGTNYVCSTGHGGLSTAPPENPNLWSATSNQRFVTGDVLVSMTAGTQLMRASGGNSTYMLAYLLDGRQGYVLISALEQVSQTQEDYILPARQITRQPFQITEIRRDRKTGTVSVHAEHVSYALGGNLLGDCNLVSVTPQTALAFVMGSLQLPYPGRLITPIGDMEITADWSWKSPLAVLMSPSDGFAAATDAYVMRDKEDIYFLPNAATGTPSYAVRYGENLLGVDCREDDASVVTRVIPVAKDENGDDLYLPELYIDSSRSYPFQRVQRIRVDAKVGETIEKTDGTTETLTKDAVLTMMREAGEACFSVQHLDETNVTISVDYIHLPKTAEYAAYQAVRNAAPYDWLEVTDTPLGVSALVRMTGFTWDLVTGQYVKIDFGQKASSSIPSYELGSGSVNARVLAAGSVGSTALAMGAVTAQAIQAGSVTADKIAGRVITSELLAADAVTAHEIAASAVTTDKLNANAVTAGKIAAGAVTTDKLDAYAVTAGKIAAGAIEAGHLSASALSAVDAEITSANISYAQIKDASVQSLIARDAVTDRYFIDKLAVRNAQMVQATVGELVIKASDSKYYRLDVAADGSVSPTEVTLTAAEIAAGETSNGHAAIIETDLTVADLSASNMKAINALIDKLTASRIDVAELFARTATINQLNAVDISGNGSLHLYVLGNSSRNFTGWADPASTASNNVHDGDIWNKTTGLRTWNDLTGTWNALAGTWNDFEAGKQYIRDNGSWVLMNDVTGKYSIVSGIDINQYGVTISGQRYIKMLSGSEIQIRAGSTFTVDSGNFSIDSSGNVTMSGVITATAGAIADWSIQPGRLKSGSGTGYVALSSDPSDTYAIWAGDETASSAPFRVARDGTTYVTKLVTITESGGSTTTVNLQNYPLWKLNYHTVKAYDASSITLSNGATINFNTAAGVVLSGGWTDNWTRYTAEARDGNNQLIASISSGVVAIWLGGSTATQANVKAALESASNHHAIVSAEADGEVIQTLTIDASGVYDSGYNSGYSDGTAAGAASVVFYSESVWSGGNKTLTLSNGLTKTVSIPDPSAWSSSYVGNKIMAVTATVGGKALNTTVDATDAFTDGQSTVTVSGWDAYFNASGVTVYVTLSNGVTRSHFFAE